MSSEQFIWAAVPQVFGNILKDPNNEKFRTLKKDICTVQRLPESILKTEINILPHQGWTAARAACKAKIAKSQTCRFFL